MNNDKLKQINKENLKNKKIKILKFYSLHHLSNNGQKKMYCNVYIILFMYICTYIRKKETKNKNKPGVLMSSKIFQCFNVQLELKY